MERLRRRYNQETLVLACGKVSHMLDMARFPLPVAGYADRGGSLLQPLRFCGKFSMIREVVLFYSVEEVIRVSEY